MKKIVEQNLAEIIVISVIVLAMSSCGVNKPYHACGITELNKQYQVPCKSTKKSIFKRK
tara:strand:- start:828 stop:1004 length:177 start_codon:yes stop_codon:yes gene_type:complete